MTWHWWWTAWSICPSERDWNCSGVFATSNSNRLAVLADLNACQWQETDFFALALQASECFQREQQTLHLFTYDLLSYKQVPDWLNAKFWANPGKFRQILVVR